MSAKQDSYLVLPSLFLACLRNPAMPAWLQHRCKDPASQGIQSDEQVIIPTLRAAIPFRHPATLKISR